MFNAETTGDQEFTDAVNHCLDLLRQNNYISDINNEVISRRSAILGQNMYEYLKEFHYNWCSSNNKAEKATEFLQIESTGNIVSDKYMIKQEPLNIVDVSLEAERSKDNTESTSLNLDHSYNQLHKLQIINNKDPEKETFSKKSTDIHFQPLELPKYPNFLTTIAVNSTNTTSKISPNQPTIKTRHSMPLRNSSKETLKCTDKKRGASFEEKKKVVELARANPTWNIKLLQEHGSPRLVNLTQLRTWEKQIRRGGSVRDNFRMVDRWTYSNYSEAIKNNQHVTRRMVREWAIEAGNLFLDSRSKQVFTASKAWIAKFMKRYKIQIDYKNDKNN